MLSSLIKPVVAKVIAPLGSGLVRIGVTPNVVTLVGTLGTVVSALVLFPTGNLFLGAVVCGAFAIFDMLDGAVARAAGGGTKFGAVLDASCDRIADGAIFGALAYWAAFPWRARESDCGWTMYTNLGNSVYSPGQGFLTDGSWPYPSPIFFAFAENISVHAVVTGFRLLFIGLLVCLVSALTISYIKARAEASGLNGDGGWIERPERLIIVLVGAGVTGLGLWQALPLAVAFLALTSVVTVGQRIIQVWRDAGRSAAGPQ